MSVFRFPCSHNASITDTASFGYLNPSSKASGIVVALFQLPSPSLMRGLHALRAERGQLLLTASAHASAHPAERLMI